ncbi:hypothetical protein P3T27_006313 [Kitasatospora sp. MAA19]|nr:hypothetical protein [Kitasatospora sp. MAA19]
MKTDGLLKESPHLAPWRPEIGIAPRLSDAELVTLAAMQALLGFTSERRWIRHAQAHLRHLFPYVPGQSGCNRRLRKAADLVARVNRLLATDTSPRDGAMASCPVPAAGGATASPLDRTASRTRWWYRARDSPTGRRAGVRSGCTTHRRRGTGPRPTPARSGRRWSRRSPRR